MIRILLIALALLAVLCLWQRGSLANAYRAADAAAEARDRMEGERDNARAELAQTAAVLATERENLAKVNAVAAQFEQDKIDAQARHDAVVADLRAGNLRLHQRWQAAAATAELSAAVATAAVADGAAVDRIESAGRIIGAAAACDAQVKGLQAYALTCSGGQP